MDSFGIELIGSAAACITTLCWVPQAFRILKTRDTRAISLVSQSAFAFGTALWFVYGLLHMSWPIIIANGLTLVLALSIVALKIRYG